MSKPRFLCVALVAAVVATAAAGARSQTMYSPDQLDNLVGPVALYPDPLLAQVLPAATFPDQIEQAAGAHAVGARIDAMPWDVSVKAVAHYPGVLDRLSANYDWTAALGQAYVEQPEDVMASVQRLRHLAWAQGNLASNRWQEVEVAGPYIAIDPMQPQYIYAPSYDPAQVYFRPGVALAFGAGLAIGAWLNYDFNWGRHQVYYTGWQGGGWIARSRPEVQINNTTYINNNYRTVTVNRAVVNQRVNPVNVTRAAAPVHANVNFDHVAAGRGLPAHAATQPAARAPAARTPEARAPSAPAAHAATPTRPATAGAAEHAAAPAAHAAPARPAPAAHAAPARPAPEAHPEARHAAPAPAKPAPAARPAAKPAPKPDKKPGGGR